MKPPPKPLSPLLLWLLALSLWLPAGVFLFARALDRDLNHDEHQFIAPGALLSREGLLPYRDYPLFHLPNLVFAYAALDRLTGDPILGPKLLSFAASWLAAGAILWVVFRSHATSTGPKLMLGAGLLGLLIFDPVFLYTSGKTWNHEVPACLLVLAVLFHVESSRRNSLAFVLLSGLACGLAAGCRLTFVPCLLPLLGVIFFFPCDPGRRWLLAIAFLGAAFVALLPTLYFLANSPEPFLFGNFEFPHLRLLDPENIRIRKTMTPWRKVRYFAKEVVLPSWPLFLAFIAATAAAWRPKDTSQSRPSPVAIVLTVTLFVLAGCFLPSRYQYQHYFALIPMLVLGVALACTSSRENPLVSNNLPVMLLILAAINGLLANARAKKTGDLLFAPVTALRDRHDWFSAKAAEQGAAIRSLVPPDGRVLTLAPSWPMAGGVKIYPEFASSPFGWRSGAFVPAEQRSEFHLVAPADLETFLAPRPPAGILTGVEDDELEKPLVQYAKLHGYREVSLGKHRQLWVPVPPASLLSGRPGQFPKSLPKTAR